MTKKEAAGFWKVVGIILLGIIGLFWYYYYLKQKDNREFYKMRYEENFLPLAYQGRVNRILYRQTCYYNLDFKGLSNSYRLCICENEEFKAFVAEGDSVIKEAGSPMATFIKPDGTRRVFTVPFCKDDIR